MSRVTSITPCFSNVGADGARRAPRLVGHRIFLFRRETLRHFKDLHRRFNSRLIYPQLLITPNLLHHFLLPFVPPVSPSPRRSLYFRSAAMIAGTYMRSAYSLTMRRPLKMGAAVRIDS